MNSTRKLTMVGLAAGMVMVAGLVFSDTASAQTPVPPNSGGPRMTQRGQGMAGMAQRRGGWQADGSLVEIAAAQFKMGVADLTAELKAGKTFAQIADARGVPLASLTDAVLAPRKTQLDAAVSAGTLTQALADAQHAQMRAQITAHLTTAWTPRGPGNGDPGSAFVDADGDGVCDQQGQGQNQPMRGQRGVPQGGMRGRMNRP